MGGSILEVLETVSFMPGLDAAVLVKKIWVNQRHSVIQLASDPCQRRPHMTVLDCPKRGN